MSNKITEFLGTNAFLYVEVNPEIAGQLLIESLGWRTYRFPDKPWEIETSSGKRYTYQSFEDDLNLMHEAERAVYERTGVYKYGKYLLKATGAKNYSDIEQVAVILGTATAIQKLAAMLWALGELEDDAK